MNKRRLALLLSLSFVSLITITAITSCNRSAAHRSRKVIAVIPKGVSHSFWLSVKAGADAAGRDLNVEINWKGAGSETDIPGQINIVEDAINRQVDGIVLAPSHGDSLVPMVQRAQREGIPVTIFDSGISTDNYLSYVATDNHEGGVLAAKRMGEILGGKGKVAILGVKKGSVSTDEREDGFAATIKEQFPGIQVAQLLYGEADASKSLKAAEDILTAHPDLKGMFASNESSTVGAVAAIRQRNLSGKVLLVGFDATPNLVNNVKEGAIDSLVIQNPFKMGYEGVKTVVDKLNGKEPQKRIDTGVHLLTKGNIETPEIQQLLK